MFTGIDIVVIALVVMGFIYINSPDHKTEFTEFTVEPLTLLVVLFVMGMIVVSLA